MDIALALDFLVAGAKYGGSISPNTEAAYASIRWEDERAKPTWAAIKAAWATVATDVAAKELATEAQAAIIKSDITIVRCYENAITVPAAWHTYRQALREIVSGTSVATELPSRPEYPEGS